jgi:hypothetical protein
MTEPIADTEHLENLVVLTAEQSERLAQLENVVSRGINKVIEVAQALASIRAENLFRGTHRTWTEYLRDKWAMSLSTASQYSRFAGVLSDLADCPVQPRTYQSVLPLNAADPKDRATIWDCAVEEAGGSTPSRALVQAVRDRLDARTDHSGRKTDTYVPKSVEVPGPVDISPEDWLARGQELIAAQRASEWQLGDWYNYGEDKFSDAHKLIEEIDFQGPSIQELRRRAKVAQIVPVAKRESLSFETAAKLVTINKPEILEQCESEQEILEAVASVRSAERVAKIRHEQAGTPAEHDEVRTELERMVPKIFQGLLNFFGESCERQVLDFLSEFIRFRFDSLKDKAR